MTNYQVDDRPEWLEATLKDADHVAPLELLMTPPRGVFNKRDTYATEPWPERAAFNTHSGMWTQLNELRVFRLDGDTLHIRCTNGSADFKLEGVNNRLEVIVRLLEGSTYTALHKQKTA